MKKYICTAADLKKIIKAKEIMDVQYKQPLTLKSIARRIGMSPTKFAILFKQKYYFNVREYLMESRVDAGIILLLDRKNILRIYEVAWECGYDTTATFSRHYKRVTGVAPTKWRKIQHSVPYGTIPWIMKDIYSS